MNRATSNGSSSGFSWAPPLNLLHTGCPTCEADSNALDRTGYEKKRDPAAFVGCSRFVTAAITAFTDLCFAPE
jgi:hypothetical protein